MTVYYVNSNIGSDQNSGTSEGAAFASLSAVERIKLQPGDSVLLAAGSVFNEQLDLKYSGTTAAPITIGSYGAGEAPIIHSSNDGIHGSKASNIIVENIKIADTGGAAIYAGNVSNWIVRNVEVSNTGLVGPGSINFQSSQNITIENSNIVGVHGDGIWMEKVSGITIVNNVVTNSQGAAADAIQLNDSSNILIKGNHLEQTETDSAKGVVALVRPVNVTVEDNTLVGGGFGIGANAGKNVVIHDNDISGFGGYSWSYGIGLGDQGNAANYDISGNYIHDGVWGVSISAAGYPNYSRTNIDIHNNVFDDLSSSALKVDRDASGSFHDNIIDNAIPTVTMPAAIAAQNTFSVGENRTLEQMQAEIDNAPGGGAVSSDAHPPVVIPVTEQHSETTAQTQTSTVAPTTETPASTPSAAATTVAKITAVHDILTISNSTEGAYHGNVLDNDVSANGNVFLRRFADAAVDKHGLTVMGKYGLIHIDVDGTFSYSVDTLKLDGLSGHVSESFQYKISDGSSHIDTDSLSISINVDDFHGSHLLG